MPFADAQLIRQNVESHDSRFFTCGSPSHSAFSLTLEGIASDLLRLVVSHAEAQSARAVYLHVVSYNAGAIAFYRRNGFEELSLLRDFYYIA